MHCLWSCWPVSARVTAGPSAQPCTIQAYQASKLSSCGFRNFSLRPSRLVLRARRAAGSAASVIGCLLLPSRAMTQKVRRGKRWTTYRYQWLCDVPLRGDVKAITVNCLMIEILDADGELTYRNSFITDMPVNRENVAELAARGRARWKIENEGFSTPKTKGYHLEHDFGHGQQKLSAVLVTLNLLAFACHTVCGLSGRASKAAMRELVTRQGFFHCMRHSLPIWCSVVGRFA